MFTVLAAETIEEYLDIHEKDSLQDMLLYRVNGRCNFIEKHMIEKIFIEAFFSVGLFVNALLFIPQAVKLLRTKNSHELSVITFAGFNVIQLFTFLHGYLHQDYLLAIGSFLSLLTCGTVTFLIFLYKVKNR